MELTGERLIPATVEQTWAALNDPAVLKACIAGCESVDRTGDDAFSAVVALKVGPVSARFRGDLKLTDIVPPTSYTIHFDGKGGVAGHGKGSADVALTPENGETRLKYVARANVGGKMAQIGSRLIDATAGKLTEDFFKAFEAYLRAAGVAAADAAGAASPSGGGAGPASAASTAARVTDAAHVPSGPASAAVALVSNDDLKKLWWPIGAVVVLAALYVMLRN